MRDRGGKRGGVGIFAVAWMVLVVGVANAEEPFVVVRQGQAEAVRSEQPTAGVLFERGDVRVLRRTGVEDAAFDDRYVVLLAPDDAVVPEWPRGVETRHFEPGRFVIVEMGDRAVREVSAELHRRGAGCGAVVRLTGDVARKEQVRDPEPIRPVHDDLADFGRVLDDVDSAEIEETVRLMSTRWRTRWHETPCGKDVPRWLAERYRSMAEGKSHVQVTTFEHRSCDLRSPQRSVIVRIEGTSRPEEVIVLGSHLDSVGSCGLEACAAPGADDDASGTATNLEVFRVWMESDVRLERTVEIHAYAAEEAGLLGSKDVAREYAERGIDVHAMVQLDMNLYKRSGRDQIFFVKNGTNARLNDLLNDLAKRYAGVETGSKDLWPASSDHSSWERKGFAASFPFEDPVDFNPELHTDDDVVTETSRFSQASAFARLALAYLAHLGGWPASRSPPPPSGAR